MLLYYVIEADKTGSHGILKSPTKNSSTLLRVPSPKPQHIGKKKRQVSLGEFRSHSFEIQSSERSTSEQKSNFTMIKAAKSEADLAEISSLYSEASFDMDFQISGTIKLGTWYKSSEGILYVRIVNASGLASIDGSSLNPYVKVYLLPGKGKQNKRRTGIQRKTNKPQYNEIVKVCTHLQINLLLRGCKYIVMFPGCNFNRVAS